MRTRAASVLGLTSLVLAGCSLLTSYDGFTGGDAATVDASVRDAGTMATVSTCIGSVPAAPVDAGTNATLTSYYAVTTSLRLDADDAGCPAGIDIDGLDTCGATPPNGPACVAANDAGPTCDDPGGVDNSSRNFLSNFNVQASLDDGLMAHDVGFVVGIDNYGGETELAGVHVTLYNVVGEADGGDGVLVDPSSYNSGVPVYTSTTAYIHDGILAATFPKFPLTLRAKTITGSFVSVHAYISDMKVLGRPRIASDGLHVDDGQVAGRISSANMLFALSEAVPCDGLALVVSQFNLCGYLDLPLDAAADGTRVTCGAISIGFGFASSPIAPPGVGDAPVIQSCPQTLNDPCTN